MNKTVTFFYRNFLILVILVFFVACNKQSKPKPVFDLDSPGSEVMAAYNDSTPQVVFYYKVDEYGAHTKEKIGEAYYYENKQEYIGGGLKDDKREGRWYAFFRDGSVQTEAFYIDGKEHGAYNVFRENGKPLFKGHYDHGVCDGTWYWYDENGKETKKIKATESTIACEWCPKCMKLKNK